ncbi:PadR family transcriptional regulator [Clostridium sp.]|uniref:PadR family transcriptional regulator n=1 Tax=Clostridium sp. TaxID=1506 RepID=UPI0032173578
MEIDKELLKGFIDILILSIIKSNDYIYGYNIMKLVNTAAGDNFELQTGTLYIALKRLEKQKLITSKVIEGDNGIKRRHYLITKEGEVQLNKLNRDFNKITELILKFREGEVNGE